MKQRPERAKAPDVTFMDSSGIAVHPGYIAPSGAASG